MEKRVSLHEIEIYNEDKAQSSTQRNNEKECIESSSKDSQFIGKEYLNACLQIQLENIKKEMHLMMDNFKMQISKITAKVTALEDKIEYSIVQHGVQEEKMLNMEKKITTLEAKITDNEDRARRNKIRIRGIQEEVTSGNLDNYLKYIFKFLGVQQDN
ncbi:Hypothetical predicted protein [Pelobates cultripes]|uniref:Uncharacterized protein n=1 Tax=Pelobates cultripes TaxID=61616 RepID=A0AAD1R2Y5_PELCU|nr:Hypothetical predicted protein [Pelobates cultripes]